MLFKKNELKLLAPFYFYYFILGFSGMIFPFMMIYFRDLNFSFFEISSFISAFSVSMFVFEIPTGAFADSYSRKYSVILGLVIVSISVILIGFFTSFWSIILLFVIAGFGMTMTSGAEEAWIMDNLNRYKKAYLFKEFSIKSMAFASFAGIFAPLIGAMIVKYFSIRPLWFIWGIGFLIGAIILFFFGKEKYKPKKIAFSNLFKETMKNMKAGAIYSYHHKTVLYLILASIFIALMMADGDFWQPFLVDLGMPIYSLGILFSIASALGVVIPFFARYLEKFKVKNVMIILLGMRILLFSTILFLNPGLFLLGSGIFIFSGGILSLRYPIIAPYFQTKIPTKVRATITSLKSMGTQLGFATGMLLFGFLADYLGVQKSIPLTGIFGLIAIYFFSRIKD